MDWPHILGSYKQVARTISLYHCIQFRKIKKIVFIAIILFCWVWVGVWVCRYQGRLQISQGLVLQFDSSHLMWVLGVGHQSSAKATSPLNPWVFSLSLSPPKGDFQRFCQWDKWYKSVVSAHGRLRNAVLSSRPIRTIYQVFFKKFPSQWGGKWPVRSLTWSRHVPLYVHMWRHHTVP